jgi:hypothetical protein
VADDLLVSVPIPAPAWSFGRFTYTACYRFFDAWTRRLLRDPGWVGTYC